MPISDGDIMLKNDQILGYKRQTGNMQQQNSEIEQIWDDEMVKLEARKCKSYNTVEKDG